MRSKIICIVMVLAPATFLAGCSLFPGDGALGGREDIASARQTIENGGIPHPDSISVDGFLSDHAIFNDGGPVAASVFLNVDAAWHRDFDALTPQATILVGFGTNIDPETFQRADLNLALLVDRSSSMDDPIDARSGTSKLEAVRIAVDRILAQLTSDDRVSVVVFNETSQTLVEGVAGSDIAAVKGALDGVTAQGGTNLVGGLRRALQTVQQTSGGQRLGRVLLFTDAPLYDADRQVLVDFLDVMRNYAQQNIGTTVFGIGTEIGDAVSIQIAQIRGGNSYYLSDFERIVSVFDEEFDFLVAPVVYDVTLTFDIPFEFDVVDVHGLPSTRPFGHQLTLQAPTLFLSPRQLGNVVFVRTRAGALVDFSQSNTFGNVTLNYTSMERDLVGLGPIRTTLPAGISPTAEPGWFENDSARRGVLLLNTVLALKAACRDMYPQGFLTSSTESRNTAINRLTEFLSYFDSMSAGLEDRISPESRRLAEERALMVKLISNLNN